MAIRSKRLKAATRPSEELQAVIKKEILSKYGPVTLILSFVIAGLALYQPLYMMSLYSRVLTSMSTATLFALTAIAVFIVIVISMFEVARARFLNELGETFVRIYSEPTFISLVNANRQDKFGAEGLNHLTSIRQIFASPELSSLLDAPFVPIYIVFMFLLHPILGALNLAGLIVVSCYTLYSKIHQQRTKEPLRSTEKEQARISRNAISNAGLVKISGMTSLMFAKWQAQDTKFRLALGTALDSQSKQKATGAGLSQVFQTIVLAFTTYLVVVSEVSVPVLFAVTILVARTLMPTQNLIAGWAGILNARDSFAYLNGLIDAFSRDSGHYSPTRSRGKLDVKNLVVTIQNSKAPLLNNVSFSLQAGEVLLLLGKSGSGKSTLMRTILGMQQFQKGSVILDGINFSEWNEEAHRKYIGYLPQERSLFDGTIVENITLFRPDLNNSCIELARKIGLTEVVSQMPNGWDSEVQPLNMTISGGTAQRLAICRALLGTPKLIVLDEPLNHLDSETQARVLIELEQRKAEGATIIISGHSPSLLEITDKILYLKNGTVFKYGPKTEVVSSIG